MKCIKVNYEIVSLENVKKVYVVGSSKNNCVLRVDYFKNEDVFIHCEDRDHLVKVLDEIFKIISENP